MQIMAKTGAALALLVVAGTASAQDLMVLDTNADGALSYPEMMVAYPDLTEDGFSVMDSSADGLLDADEVTAALDAGMITAPEG